MDASKRIARMFGMALLSLCGVWGQAAGAPPAKAVRPGAASGPAMPRPPFRFLGGADLPNGLALVKRCEEPLCKIQIEATLPPIGSFRCGISLPAIVVVGAKVEKIVWTVDRAQTAKAGSFKFRDGDAALGEVPTYGVRVLDTLDYTGVGTSGPTKPPIWQDDAKPVDEKSVTKLVAKPSKIDEVAPPKASLYEVFMQFERSQGLGYRSCEIYDPIIVNTGS